MKTDSKHCPALARLMFLTERVLVPFSQLMQMPLLECSFSHALCHHAVQLF